MRGRGCRSGHTEIASTLPANAPAPEGEGNRLVTPTLNPVALNPKSPQSTSHLDDQASPKAWARLAGAGHQEGRQPPQRATPSTCPWQQAGYRPLFISNDDGATGSLRGQRTVSKAPTPLLSCSCCRGGSNTAAAAASLGHRKQPGGWRCLLLPDQPSGLLGQVAVRLVHLLLVVLDVQLTHLLQNRQGLGLFTHTGRGGRGQVGGAGMRCRI